jgi:nucleoside-diphosphate-sugar epimerase
LGVEAKIVHVPSDVIAKYDFNIGDSLLGDKTHSMIFDNSKVKNAVPDFICEIPFEEGAKEIVDWYMADVSRQSVDTRIDTLFDTIISDYNK